MSLGSAIAFLIWLQIADFTSATIISCLVYVKNGEGLRVEYYCDTTFQKCCNTGCCDKDETEFHYLWYFLIFVAAAFLHCLKQFCSEEESENRSNRSRPIITPLRIQNQNNYQNLQNIDDNSPQPGLNNLPSSVQLQIPEQTRNDSQPITPPPSYEDAVRFPPNLPFSIRVPSNENVAEACNAAK